MSAPTNQDLHGVATGAGSRSPAVGTAPPEGSAAATYVPGTRVSRRGLVVAGLVVVSALVGLGVAVGLRLRRALAEQARLDAERARAAAADARPRELEVVVPEATTYTPSITLTGALEPVLAADLGFEVGGRLLRVDVALGQQVREGQVLGVLDRASIVAQQAASSAGVRVAEANHAMIRDRVQLLEELTRSGAAPARDLTAARQQLQLAEAQVDQARAAARAAATTSADHTLRAPFAGVVTRVPSGPGAVVGPGVPVFRVERLDELRLHTTVAEEDLEFVRVGAVARIEAVNARASTREAKAFTGTVRSVVRSLDPATRRAPVEFTVPNSDGALVAHALVRAYLETGPAVAALRVPGEARRADGTVFVVDPEGRVAARHVVASLGADGAWLVTEGLAAEDLVLARAAEGRAGEVVAVRVRRELPPPARSSAPVGSPAPGSGASAAEGTRADPR
jgi:RND family efflux transporter MFP subunit